MVKGGFSTRASDNNLITWGNSDVLKIISSNKFAHPSLRCFLTDGNLASVFRSELSSARFDNFYSDSSSGSLQVFDIF